MKDLICGINMICFWKHEREMKSEKKRKGTTVEKKGETEEGRAAAVCGRIRVVSRDGRLLRRKEALMDKGEENACNGLLF